MVNPPAILPDLSLVPCQRCDVAHLHHGLGELREECLFALRVPLHQPHGGRAAAGEEDLVGGEEALPGNQVLEVLVVEPAGAQRVEGKQVLVAAGARAAAAQLCGVRRIQSGVRSPVARLVVQPLPEAGAPRVPDRVAACTHRFMQRRVTDSARKARLP